MALPDAGRVSCEPGFIESSKEKDLIMPNLEKRNGQGHQREGPEPSNEEKPSVRQPKSSRVRKPRLSRKVARPSHYREEGVRFQLTENHRIRLFAAIGPVGLSEMELAHKSLKRYSTVYNTIAINDGVAEADKFIEQLIEQHNVERSHAHDSPTLFDQARFTTGLIVSSSISGATSAIVALNWPQLLFWLNT
jgi:hypothetical protein